MATKKILQFSTNRGHLHFQYGVEKNYRNLDLPMPKKANLKGLKTQNSLARTSTTYYIVPVANLAKDRLAAFREKRGFSLAKVAAFVKAADSE